MSRFNYSNWMIVLSAMAGGVTGFALSQLYLYRVPPRP